MTYATQSDISPRRLTESDLIQLTDDTSSGVVNAEVVNDALEAASGLIESYCRQRYTLPLQQTKELTKLTVDIAVYELYGRRPGSMNDDVSKRFDDAQKFLKDISAGKASLDQPTPPASEQGASGGAVVTRIPQVFSDENLRGGF
jgi:phage gp36-like protein